MERFDEELARAKEHLEVLAKRADGLKNKNLRDIAKAGIARFLQALDHPDMKASADEEHRAITEGSKRDEDVRAGRPIDVFNASGAVWKVGDGPQYDREGKELPPAPVVFMDVFNAQGGAWKFGDGQQFDKDGKPIDNGAKHPSDPCFDASNRDFRDPNNADLNKDGTLKQAPNTFGRTDERDKK